MSAYRAFSVPNSITDENNEASLPFPMTASSVQGGKNWKTYRSIKTYEKSEWGPAKVWSGATNDQTSGPNWAMNPDHGPPEARCAYAKKKTSLPSPP